MNPSIEKKMSVAESDERLRQVTGGLAHDFSNVLAGVLGSVELAQTELPAGHPAQPFLESIVEASNRGRELILQIQAFGRRQSGEKSVMPLQPVIAECVKALRATVPASVRITWHVENSCPPVLADPMAIQQAILNLGTNAWHALPATDGQIDITLQAAKSSEVEAVRIAGLPAGSYVRLTVRDNGCGMDAATQERIFEPFFTTKRARKAVGLGLSIANNIIRAHEGAILVQSAPGNGTTFSMYLPAQAATATIQPSLAEETPARRGGRIMLVDDEPTLAAVTEKSLVRSGYAVTRFERAERALEKFRETPDEFDLVITDYAMPGMSGTDLAKALLQVRANLPVLLVSGFVDQPVSDAATAIGVREVLLKPVGIDDLRAAVNRWLTEAKPPPPD
jgi:nitrogen-specific signal transduction histidine kinase/CheY-like chemotaxis protein